MNTYPTLDVTYDPASPVSRRLHTAIRDHGFNNVTVHDSDRYISVELDEIDAARLTQILRKAT